MKEIISKTRTYRRFREERRIKRQTLLGLLELARLGGSARNCQPWQYLIIDQPEECAAVFPLLGWAGYLTDWRGPEPGERPSAYILCLLNRNRLKGSELEAQFDLGIATQNLLLGAMTEGIGGCRIGSFSAKIADLFEMPEHLAPGLVIALGYPAETVVLEETAGADIRYWRDAAGIHHVPKRPLTDLVIELPCRDSQR